MTDFLRFFAFQDVEIFFVEACDQPIHGIGNCDWNQDQIHINFKRFVMRL